MTMWLSDAGAFTALDVITDGPFEVLGIASHRTPGLLVFAEEPRWMAAIGRNPAVTSVITTLELADQVPAGVAFAVSTAPRRSFFELHNALACIDGFYWTDFATEIDPGARIHPRAFVAERNVRIGAECIVEAHANVLERVVLGAGCILRTGSTIGSHGFEFKRVDGRVLSVAHAGGVRLGDAVEVQANSAISRAVFGGFTDVGHDTKLDNLVHVAHNARIGARCLLAAQAMIAGSATVGDDVWIGPGVCVSSGVTVGNGANLTIGSVVTRDVDAGQHVTGNFAVDHRRFLSHLRTMR